MKVLYLHQYFRTPAEGGAIRSFYLAKSLVDKGFDVDVITSHNDTSDKTIEIEGIRVHYLSVYYDNSLGFLGRAFSFLKFVLKAYKKAKELKEGTDICYATSTPLTIGLIALRLKKKHTIPYYFEVRDLWPEAPIQMGVINNPFLKKFLYYIERKIYLNAQRLIALSPGIRDGIEKSLGQEKPIYILPNISDCDYFYPEGKSPGLEEKFHTKGKFVVSYFGAIGKVNNLDFMIDIIRKCKERDLNIHFIIAGKGSEDLRIKGIIEQENLDNASFIGFHNKEGIKEVLNVTDAAYISFADKPILETNSPNKFFDAIAAGKLCIVNTKGWIKELIEQKESGFYANPYDPLDFIRKIEPFMRDKSSLLLYQNNSRKMAESYFSRSIQTERFIKLFDKEEKLDAIFSSVYTLTA